MPLNFSDKSIWGANLSSGFGLNNFNQPFTGQVSASGPGNQTSQPSTYASNSDQGKRLWVPQNEIANFTYTANGTLYGGMYQMVQVSASATAANVAVGKVAYILDGSQGSYIVTDEAHATSTAMIAGIFLNTITPGNFGFIFVGGGKVNVLPKASLTNGTPAIGDNIVAGGGTGFVDDAAAKTVAPTALFLGTAITLPAGSTAFPIWMKSPIGLY